MLSLRPAGGRDGAGSSPWLATGELAPGFCPGTLSLALGWLWAPGLSSDASRREVEQIFERTIAIALPLDVGHGKKQCTSNARGGKPDEAGGVPPYLRCNSARRTRVYAFSQSTLMVLFFDMV
jgi:hypothetical protein